MERIDYIIVLGAQVGVNAEGKMFPAFHTEMRARAAGLAWQRGMAKKFIVTGGCNIFVRYDLSLSAPVYGAPNSNKKPDFSDEAKKISKRYRSEASVIAELMRNGYGVPPEALIFEEDSATTAENASFCAEILKRSGKCDIRVGILTLLYHMERALGEFRTAIAKQEGQNLATAIPVFAENILASSQTDSWWIEKICEYYGQPKGGKQWNVAKIRQLLSEKKSLTEMLI